MKMTIDSHAGSRYRDRLAHLLIPLLLVLVSGVFSRWLRRELWRVSDRGSCGCDLLVAPGGLAGSTKLAPRRRARLRCPRRAFTT